METPQASVKKIAINYGLLWGLGVIALGVITYVTDTYLERPVWATVAGLAIMVAALYMGMNTFKKESGGYMSLGQALKVGMAITLIAAIIGAIWTYLLTTVIEPNFVDRVLEATAAQMTEANPNMSQEEMDMAMTWTERMTQPWLMASLGIVWTLFVGFIFSLITGLILKRPNPMD